MQSDGGIGVWLKGTVGLNYEFEVRRVDCWGRNYVGLRIVSFSDLMEQTVEQNSNELIWVLLNTGEVKVFDPNDWRTIRPLLFVDCTDTDRSKAVRALRDTKEYPSLR